MALQTGRFLACHDCYGTDRVPSVPQFSRSIASPLIRVPDHLAATDRISDLGERLRVPRRRVL